mgnify:CR=1 FL=1
MIRQLFRFLTPGQPEPAPEGEVLRLREELGRCQAELGFTRQLLDRLALFNESLESTQSSLAGMASRLQAEQDSARQAVGQTASGQAEVQTMAASLDELAGNSARSAGQVAHLDKRAGEIVGVVDTIRDVAGHIKLLSLNAAVEAARAGQHGAGFAVVAHEVRSLAEKSGVASEAITKLAAGIRDISSEACGEIERLATGARTHSARGKSVMDTMQGVMGIAGELEQVVSSSSLRSFVELAKLDHVVFKFRIYRALLGQLELDPSTLSSHQACRLGKWYYQGEGHRCFSHLRVYRDVEHPHRLVHEAAAQAVALQREGADADAVLECVELMERSSFDVIAALERLAVAGTGGSGHDAPAQRRPAAAVKSAGHAGGEACDGRHAA